MVEELVKQVIVQTPIAAVLLYALWIVYKDLKDRMSKADEERGLMLAALLDNTRRTKLIEQETIGDISPTLPRRPD